MSDRKLDPRMSLTTPSMTWEFESACHCLSRYVLTQHLDQKFGPKKWTLAGAGYKDTTDADGVARLSNETLAANAVECGLAEFRRQLGEYDRMPRNDLFAAAGPAVAKEEK